jgi:hypothetical protein
MDGSRTGIKIVLSIFILISACSYNNRSKFGQELNSHRQKIGLPLLPADWTITKKGEDFNGQQFETYLNPNRIERKQPSLFSKTVKYKGDELISERNEYHTGQKYETIDGHSYISLIITYSFREDREGSKLYQPGWHISYYSADDQLMNLTIQQADSLLRTWGLSRQPI